MLHSKKFFLVYTETLMTSFFDLRFLEVLRIVERTNAIFGILRKFWARNMCFYAKILIWKFCLFDLTLTWPPSNVKLDDVIGSNDCHHRYMRTKWPRKHVSRGMFVTFIVTFCDPTFCDLFAASLTHLRAQKVETLHCDLWPDLTRDLILKMLSMD